MLVFVSRKNFLALEFNTCVCKSEKNKNQNLN